jgi:amino acid transporter
MSIHRKRNRSLGYPELVAIALGGMVGGGIFTVLGISVAMIGSLTPIAIAAGGLIALLAAYSYVKLGKYYKDEGASFSFYKRTFPNSHFAPSILGWLVIFGYISTLSLYAYTFASYVISATTLAGSEWAKKGMALGVVAVFTGVNLWSVSGMGKLEDIMVYTKLLILLVISGVLMKFGSGNFTGFVSGISVDMKNAGLLGLVIVSSLTFVAYEGFQLVINATGEMRDPDRNISRGIYTAIALAVLIYIVISVGALLAIPEQDIIANKEFALAAGMGDIAGKAGSYFVILGAVLATSSAISSTLFGASRQMMVVAQNGYLPNALSKTKRRIPVYSIIAMALFSSVLIIVGGLELILEFGSITFMLVSLLMALANFKIRAKTKSSTLLTALAIAALCAGSGIILYYEFTNELKQMLAIIAIYVVLAAGAFIYAKRRDKKGAPEV